MRILLFVELVYRHRSAVERFLPRFGCRAIGRGGRIGPVEEIPEDRARVDSEAAQERYVRVPIGSSGHSAQQIPIADRGR